MDLFGSYYLCSVLLFFSVPGIWTWSASNFSSLLEGIRSYKGYRAKILTADAQVFLQGSHMVGMDCSWVMKSHYEFQGRLSWLYDITQNLLISCLCVEEILSGFLF